jgi:hypothetical protein
MSIQSDRELETSREKLRTLEQLYARKHRETAEDPHLRDWTLQSLKQLINQFQEEIIRYECRAGRRANEEHPRANTSSSQESECSSSEHGNQDW